MIHDFYKRNGLRVHEIPVGKKHPTAAKWPDSNKSYDEVEKAIESNLFNKYGWLLDDDHLVIDIDLHNDQENGLESLEKFDQQTGVPLDSVCKAIVYSPSGGRHYYFKNPSKTKLKRSSKLKFPGIDFIAGRGKQVVAANSFHDKYEGIYILGQNAELVEIPDVVLNALVELSDNVDYSKSFCHESYTERSGDEFNKSQKGIDVIISSMMACGYTFRKVNDYYEFDRPGKSTESKCSGHVGKKSKQGNYQLTCFSLSDSNFPSGESISIFHAYASLKHSGNHVDAANELYELGFAKQDYALGVDLTHFMQNFAVDDSPTVNDPKDPGPFPADCLEPPGFIGDVARYTLATSDEPQPILALGGAMCLLSALTGRKIRNRRDNRTNIFVLGLAPSGAGKDRPRKVNMDILRTIGCPEFIGANSLGSGHGLESQLRIHPSKVFHLDELGDLLKAIKKERGSFKEGVLEKIKMLMTSSHQLYSNSATADNKLFFTIDQPHLVIFGTATPEKFWNNLSIDSVEDGFMGRVFPLEVTGYAETQEPADIEIPDRILIQAKAWADFKPNEGNIADQSPSPVIYELSEDARKRHAGYCKDIDDKIPKDGTHKPTDGLWKRARGRSATLALLFAASRIGPCHNGTIEKIDVDLAIKITNWITRRTIYKISTQVSENPFEANCNRMLELLKKRSGGYDRTQLSQVARWLKPKERREVLEQLLERNAVIQFEQKTGTKTRVIFQAKSNN